MVAVRTVPQLGAWDAQAAADWIWANNQRFQGLGFDLAHLKMRAAAVEGAALAAGDIDQAAAAVATQDALDALIGRWRWTADQLRWVVQRIPGIGLGAWVIPVAVSAVALVAVVAGIKVLGDARNAERVVELLEAGQITVEQARSLGLDVSPPLISWGGGAVLALAAGVGAWWVTQRRGRRR